MPEDSVVLEQVGCVLNNIFGDDFESGGKDIPKDKSKRMRTMYARVGVLLRARMTILIFSPRAELKRFQFFWKVIRPALSKTKKRGNGVYTWRFCNNIRRAYLTAAAPGPFSATAALQI